MAFRLGCRGYAKEGNCGPCFERVETVRASVSACESFPPRTVQHEGVPVRGDAREFRQIRRSRRTEVATRASSSSLRGRAFSEIAFARCYVHTSDPHDVWKTLLVRGEARGVQTYPCEIVLRCGLRGRHGLKLSDLLNDFP